MIPVREVLAGFSIALFNKSDRKAIALIFERRFSLSRHSARVNWPGKRGSASAFNSVRKLPGLVLEFVAETGTSSGRTG